LEIQDFQGMKRRDFIQIGLATPAASYTIVNTASQASLSAGSDQNIKHSVCRWCYSNVPLEELCDKVKDIGIHSIELLHPDEWATVQAQGLECAVGYANDWGLTKGFNNPDLHDALLRQYEMAIDLASRDGIPQIIAFPGNRNGIDDLQGLENCAYGLAPIVKRAEKEGVIITMELMNSKIDHPDYQADSTDWGVRLVKKIGSPNFKLLYDIYHMQIMEGDIIRTINENVEYISHFHTAGVPGRHEIDESQELNYSAIARAIKLSGFKGYIGQEYIPSTDDAFSALSRAVEICDVLK